MGRVRDLVRTLAGGLRRGGGASSDTPGDLRSDVERLGTWMYRFELGDGIVTPLHDEWLAEVHDTRYRMIMPELEDRFGGRWPGVTCLDAGCNEGYYGFEIAKRGARSVVGFDARPGNIEKAELVKRAWGTPNISFRVDDISNLTVERYGSFTLTLALGLLYHLEDHIGALRRLRAVTEDLCVVDTQVLRESASVSTASGREEELTRTEDIVAVVEEPEWEWNPLASVTGLSLVPSRSALQTMLRHTGFSDVKELAPCEGACAPYAKFDRVILLAS